jgi:hypothetical protein
VGGVEDAQKSDVVSLEAGTGEIINRNEEQEEEDDDDDDDYDYDDFNKLITTNKKFREPGQAVSIETMLRLVAWAIGFRFPADARGVFFSTAFRLDLRPTHLLIQCVWEAFPPG